MLFSIFFISYEFFVLLIAVVILIGTGGTLDGQVRIGENVAYHWQLVSRRNIGELLLCTISDNPNVATVIATDVAVERIFTLVLRRTVVIVAPLIEVGTIPSLG